MEGVEGDRLDEVMVHMNERMRPRKKPNRTEVGLSLTPCNRAGCTIRVYEQKRRRIKSS